METNGRESIVVLLTITAQGDGANLISFLLHKRTHRMQHFSLPFGEAHVFYPVVSPQRCQVAFLVEVDSVGLIRRVGASLAQYVNDRPYVASSLFSVALNTVFREALAGKCKLRPELVDVHWDLQAELAVVRCRGGEHQLRQIFEPLGYSVSVVAHALDPHLGWQESQYFTVQLTCRSSLAQLLNHLYVLLPVLDNHKHYYIDRPELEKLVQRGQGWLAAHPALELIVGRYLKNRKELVREALARLQIEDAEEEVGVGAVAAIEPSEKSSEPRLHEQRLERVVQILKEKGCQSVLDLGCGSGKLLALLRKYRTFQKLLGMDVSYSDLEVARERLKVSSSDGDERLQLIHGSLLYRDPRLQGFDGAAVVEVIEHLDPERLEAFELCLFGFARPGFVVLTTPNKEYNQLYPNLAQSGRLRHKDHRFEWDRQQFETWLTSVCDRYGYAYQLELEGVGPQSDFGAPSQLAQMTRVGRG